MKRLLHPQDTQDFTRRQFLQVSGLGILAAFGLTVSPDISWLRPGNLNHDHLFAPDNSYENLSKVKMLDPNQQGRVLAYSLDIYDVPSLDGRRVNRYWRDSVLPVTDITIGKSIDSFNMVWYKIGNEGYAHSGDIQPVLTIQNPVADEISEGGTVAEVTVPYTDAHWAPGDDEPVAYRFYYATTYWVTNLVYDGMDNPWYGVRDDKWDYIYYVPAAHLRIIPQEEIRPISMNVPSNQKRIEVHLPAQVLIAYEYDQPIYMARVATGAIFSNGDYSTPSGNYTTFHKRYSRHMARGNLAANGYDLPGVPWNSYITEEGIAFHGTYWHNNFGRPRSHGCINLTPQAAKWVYLWTMPTVPPDQEWIYEDTGTSVEIIG